MGSNFDAGPYLGAWLCRSKGVYRLYLLPSARDIELPVRISQNVRSWEIESESDLAKRCYVRGLGMSLLLKENPEKALRALQEGAKIGGIPPKMYNNLALALCTVGRYREALEALKKSGHEASAYYRLGNIYLAQGKYKEAAESFEKAIELKPEFHVKAYEKKRQALAALALSAGDATTER